MLHGAVADREIIGVLQDLAIVRGDLHDVVVDVREAGRIFGFGDIQRPFALGRGIGFAGVGDATRERKRSCGGHEPELDHHRNHPPCCDLPAQ